jgi:hypothetical protein
MTSLRAGNKEGNEKHGLLSKPVKKTFMWRTKPIARQLMWRDTDFRAT